MRLMSLKEDADTGYSSQMMLSQNSFIHNVVQGYSWF